MELVGPMVQGLVIRTLIDAVPTTKKLFYELEPEVWMLLGACVNLQVSWGFAKV